MSQVTVTAAETIPVALEIPMLEYTAEHGCEAVARRCYLAAENFLRGLS